MKAKETLQDLEFRLKQLAKQSKDNSTQFRYIANGVDRMIINNNKLLQKSR